MKINIKKLDGKTIILEVEPTTYIGEIKQKIKEQENIPFENQILFFHSQFLKDDFYLAVYNIQNNSNIYLILKKEEDIPININILGSEKQRVLIKSTDKIKDIKTQIEKLENIPNDEQIYFFHDKILDNNETLSHYNIQSYDTILCTYFFKYMNIKLNEKIEKIRYDDSYTIFDFKIKIKHIFKIYQHGFDLLYNGKILDNEKTIKDCHIPNKSIIEIKENDKMFINAGNPNIDNEMWGYNKFNQVMLNKIIELGQELKSKEEIFNHIKKDIISVIFISEDEIIHKSFICKKTDKFIVLEQLLYESFPDYIKNNNYFTVKGNNIEKLKTIEQNNINDGDIILIKIKNKI